MSTAPPPPSRRRIIASSDGTLPTPVNPASARPPAAAPPPAPWRRPSAEQASDSSVGQLDVAELARRIAHNEGLLRERLAAALGSLDVVRANGDSLADATLAAANADADAAARRASEQYEAERARLAHQRDHGANELRARLATLLPELAAGAAGAPFAVEGSWSRDDFEAGLQRYARVGTVEGTAGDGEADGTPALLPLRVGSGWVLAGEPEASTGVLAGTLLRLMAEVHPSRLRIQTFDPRSSGRLARLAGARAVHPGTFGQPHVSPASFLEQVSAALALAPLNAERAAVAGAADFVDLWRLDPQAEGTLTVLAALDYPYGITPELNAGLHQLAQLGPSSGTLVLLQHDASVVPPDRVDAQTLMGLLPRIDVTRRGLVSSVLSGLEVRPEPAPSREHVDQVLAAMRRRLTESSGQTVPLETLIADDLVRPWQRSSKDSVEMVLGVAGRETLTMSFRTENPPHSNVLLGGMVGTGKSNTLKDLIYSAAVRYSPDELEFILLDFKSGIEFKSFDADDSGQGWLPHVSVLGLESDQEYGVAVLQSVASEIDRRSRLFRDAGGASSIVRFRESTGEQLPRLLVVIDEFHVLLEGDEELSHQAADNLELIAKQGRAFGVHLLLASQALSGISGLRTKADAIFSQFPVRVSLKNSVSESQSFLSQGNRAAAELVHRGEVIVNRNLGQQPEIDNIRGLAAFVDQSRFGRVQHDLWELDHRRRPQVFMGAAYAPWDGSRLDAIARSRPGTPGYELWLGRPVSVDDAPAHLKIRADAAQLVALVGSDQGRDRVVPNVLSSMLLSLSHQLPAGSEIVVLDSTGDDTLGCIMDALAHATEVGLTVRCVASDRVAAYLRETTADRLAHGGDHDQVIFGLGLQRVPGLDDAATDRRDDDVEDNGGAPLSISVSSLSSPSFSSVSALSSASSMTAREVIAALARRGGLSRTFVVGWWSGLASLEQTLGLSHNGVSAYVTTGCGLEDLKKIAGPLTKKLAASPRVGVFDRDSDAPLRPVVPFELFTAQELAARGARELHGADGRGA